MRTSINLATRPWVDTGTIMRRLRNAVLVLAAVALLALLGLHFESQKAINAELQRESMDAEATRLQNEKQNFAAQLKLPANQAVLARAQLLNQIFAGKSFSWTAVMMDLERVLPAGLHVVAMEPQVLPSGDIVVRLRVNGDRDRAVEMVRNLERSRRFRTPRVAEEAVEAASNAAQAQAATPFRPATAAAAPAGTTFDILADYNPLTESEQAGGKTVVNTTTVKTTVHSKTKKPVTAPATLAPVRPKPSAASASRPVQTPQQTPQQPAQKALPPLIPPGAAGSTLPRPRGGPAQSHIPGGAR